MRLRAKRLLVLLFVGCAQFAVVSSAQGAVWVCPQADGTELYSDRDLGSPCREIEQLPPLQRAPVVPRSEDEVKPEEKNPPLSESKSLPEPGRGRRIDPPSDGAIMYTLL